MKLELTIDEINVVLTGLGRLPLDQSLNVFSKVRQQAETQLKEEQSVDHK